MPFPNTAVLDSFSRPNEDPLSGAGIWAPVNATPGLRVLNNECADNGSAATAGMYYKPQTFTNFEVFVTVGSVTVSVGDGILLYGRLKEVGGATWDGYALTVTTASTAQLLRFDNGSANQIGAVVSFGSALVTGDRLLFRGVGTQLQTFVFQSGIWKQLHSIQSQTYLAAGYIGLLILDNADYTIDNFGGGEIIEPNVPGPIAGRGATW